MYIFVDNRPWSKSAPPLSTYLWLTLVTNVVQDASTTRLLVPLQYGNSPFANRKGREEKKKQVDEDEDEDADEETREGCSKTNNKKTDNGKKWFSLIDAIMFSMKKQRAKKLHDAFYGFIVFEVEWANVRGISYLNELQTDTSFAIEAKLMRRWEFESIDQAVTNVSQWFYGTKAERPCLRKYLDTTKGIVTFSGEVFHDASKDFSNTSPVDDEDNLSTESVSVETDSPCCSRRLFSVDHENQHLTQAPDGENKIQATDYKDVLVLVRFCDRDLPFKLREVIMSDIRLLTLLEAGLPSWLLFLQSYPCLCHLYRPWMYLLARALYVMIPVITVVIGFYDLYKNVPVLKATASRLCGPLFDWVETWDMVSRIKYLGTMLFLHNVQKAVKWGLKIVRGMQSFASLFVMPLVKPLIKVLALLLPLWNALEKTVLSLVSVVGTVIGFGCSLVGIVVEVVLLPFSLIVSVVFNVVNIVVLPLFWILREVLHAPIRVVLALANGLALSFSYIFHVLGVLWRYMSRIVQFASDSRKAVKPYEVPMWRTLWNDLFSHIFRAVRSILNGLVAFFAACNKHRLSIYNHIQDFIKRLRGRTSRADSTDSERGRSAKNHKRTVSFSSMPSSQEASLDHDSLAVPTVATSPAKPNTTSTPASKLLGDENMITSPAFICINKTNESPVLESAMTVPVNNTFVTLGACSVQKKSTKFAEHNLGSNKFASLLSMEEEEDSLDSVEETDSMDFMTPFGKRILQERPVKPSAKAREIHLESSVRRRGNRGRGNRNGRG